jgi:antitoxin HicB
MLKGAAMLAYPVSLSKDTNGTYLVEVPDLPEANAVGDDHEEALLNAADAIATALGIYFDERRPVPLPSKAKKGKATVVLPAIEEAKVLLWNEMLAQNIRKAELARRLNVHMPQIDRLFNLKHSTKVEFIEQAAKALGKQLHVTLI